LGIKPSLAFLAVLLAFFPVHAGEPPTAKYVILMIGDGMGIPQRAAAECYLHAREARRKDPPGMKTRRMNRFPAQGITTTYSRESCVTDSAAAATAIACGQKTLNHALSMDPTLKTKLKSLAEIAKERGLKVGLVTSVSIGHATPAAFCAHQPRRDSFYEIAMELAASSFDYFGGGAAKGAQPAVAKGRPSPVEAARKNGFVLVTRREELQALKPDGQKVWAFNHTCDEEAALYYEIDRPADLQELETAYAWSLVPKAQRPFALFLDLFPYGGEEPFAIKCTQILDHQAGFLWATLVHSGPPVQTSAIGGGHELFHGYHDNTDLFRELLSVLPAATPAATP
jgi:alkaline phosphatase